MQKKNFFFIRSQRREFVGINCLYEQQAKLQSDIDDLPSYFNATKKNLNESQEELVNTKPLSVESNQRLQQAKIQSDLHDIQVSFNFINIL